MSIRPKKYLGQHFLKSPQLAKKIVDALEVNPGDSVLEIGPGTGILSQFLLNKDIKLHLVEVDRDSVAYLNKKYPGIEKQIIERDILKLDLSDLYPATNVSIIGNLPYNISSQIFFSLLKYRNHVDQVVCMIQKEVARRITSPPGSKIYGILSVLLQAYFDMEYLFEIKPGSFYPPPKVDSSVIRMKRNKTRQLDCDEKLFFRVVKQGFQNRRKTLRNALKPINLPGSISSDPLLDLRAERLDVENFVHLTNKISREWKV